MRRHATHLLIALLFFVTMHVVVQGADSSSKESLVGKIDARCNTSRDCMRARRSVGGPKRGRGNKVKCKNGRCVKA